MNNSEDRPRSKAVVPARSYDVGYGKPPKSTRFRKGMSGNPRGRPKGSGSLSARLQQMLGEEIAVQQAGTSRRMKKGDAVLAALIARAARGDAAAARLILNANREYEEALLAQGFAASVGSAGWIEQLSDEELVARIQAMNREIARADPSLAARLKEEAGDD